MTAQVAGNGERVGDGSPNLIARQIRREAVGTLEESDFFIVHGRDGVTAHIISDFDVVEVGIVNRELRHDGVSFFKKRRRFGDSVTVRTYMLRVNKRIQWECVEVVCVGD